MKPPSSVGAGVPGPRAPVSLLPVVRAGSALLLFLLAWLWPVAGLRAADPEVTGIRFGVHDGRTRIVVDFDRRLEPAVVVRTDPPRLVLDLPEVRFRVRPDPLGSPRGLATGHRYGRLEPGRSRIVFDLSAPFRIARQFLLPPSTTSGFWRFVLDLEAEAPPPPPAVAAAPAARVAPMPVPRPETAPEDGPREVARAGPAPETGAPAPRPEPAPRPAPVPKQPVIVLDPGHGGVDPGTIGVNGEPEKNVTLAMARVLARVLRESGRYTVHLTRDDDRFIPLRERIAIARRLGADLFLSLHADSIDDRRVRGASVYTLSEQASDAEAERLAHKENRVDVLAGVDLSVQDEIVAGILIDLARRDTNNKSIIFAETLIEEIDDVAELLRRTRRYAGFAVLKAPDTPSVLLELGYLSNPRDAARLSDPRYRERLARSFARGIDRAIDKHPPPH
jgi:N-acetylmuramoyl-L-alanine amidase